MHRHFLAGMARASVCLLVCASAALSFAAHRLDSGRFYFVKPLGYSRRAGDGCSTCYGDECYDMKYARCELYMATSELLYTDLNSTKSELPTNNMRSQVDSLLMDFIEEASASPAFKECLPLISAYSDCTKENTCLGCKTCSCDADGLWNCTIVQNCRGDPPVSEDHRTLVAVMEHLMDNNKLSRKKRFATNESPVENDTKAHSVTYEEISGWMYGVKPFNYAENFTETTEVTTTDGATTSADIQNITTINYTEAKTDVDYLAFDDVLNSIGIQGKTYSRRRPLDLNNVTVVDHELTDFDNLNLTFDHFNSLKAANHFIDILNAIEDQNTIEASTDVTTDVVIDLLEVARKRVGMSLPPTSFNISDSKEIRDNSLNELKDTGFESSNDFVDFNIMKRDVSKVDNTTPNSSFSGSVTRTIINNDTPINHLLKTAVNLSLDKIIESKEKELKSLLFIRNKIIEYVKGNTSKLGDMVLNDTSVTDNITNAYYSFYNIIINPETSTASTVYRRSNKYKNDSYLEKLKRDILVVMRDLTVLQKLMGGKKFSPPLKNLVKAMRHYIHNTDEIYSDLKKKLTSSRINFDTRRHWIYPYPANKDLIKRYIVEILQVIDKDMPQSNALDPLSPKSREILKRIIKNQNVLDSYYNISQTDDSQYNLDSLKDMGLKWGAITSMIMHSKPADKIYNLKLLQLIILTDMNKIKEVITKLDFLQNRRVIEVTDSKSEKALMRINNDLKTIHSKINKILRLQNRSKKSPKVNFNSRAPEKKQTLLKHIRNLLRGSKDDIIDLLRRKIPKSEIVKELARKKLNEMVNKNLIKYRTVMRKWQDGMNILRKRRSALFVDSKKRMKNILPKYLRGKVDNGLKNSTKTKNKRSKSRKKSHSKRNKAQTLRTTTTTTTKKTTNKVLSTKSTKKMSY